MLSIPNLDRTNNLIKVISGPRLGQCLHRLPDTARAALGVAFSDGEIVVHGMTREVAATLMRTSVIDLARAAKCDPEARRESVGEAIAKFIEPQPRPVSDARVVRFINEVGAARILDQIDRLTAPVALAAE